MYDVLLELVKLTERHTGAYLAQQVADTLTRYRIDKWLHLINEDNASNCDTTATNLTRHIPHFRGMSDRLRCFLHCVQLAAEMLLSFFNKQYKRKRAGAASTATTSSLDQAVEDDLQEILGGVESESEALARLIESQSGRAEHDQATVTGVRQLAIRDMAQRGVTFTPTQAATAIRVLPKHAALAIKTRDSGHIRDTFERLVSEHPADRQCGEYRTLSPRNATRWGSDYRLLQSYHALRVAVDKLLSLPLSLGNLRLTAEEQLLADNLRDMLAPIEEVTKTFQTNKVPLIMDVIPAYDQLQRDFHAMANTSTLPPICRVAAHAAYLMTRKYYSRLEECDAYFLSVVMCPDRKLMWFYKNGWSHEDVAQIRDTALRRFADKFKPPTEASPPVTAGPETPRATTSGGVHRWRQNQPSAPALATTHDYSMDSMVHYLSLPPHPLPAGMTVLKFWDSQLTITPALAAMGLAFVSAPASTAPAEREFSEGRTQVDWNQESMSSQTFRAKMSVGSWAGAPWYDIETAANIIAASSRSLRTPSG